jgi:hypothetical protein
LKVLHIYNTGGVASTLAKFMDKEFGTKSNVVSPRIADPYYLTVYGEIWNVSLNLFKFAIVFKARNYDIIHCHSTSGVALFLKRLFPRKTVILHYHGSDIRGKWSQQKKYWSRMDAVLVSTRDLLEGAPKGVLYLPNPVDTSIFRNFKLKRPFESITFSYGADDLAKTLAIKHNLKPPRFNTKFRKKYPIKYVDMPRTLNMYEYYVDVKKKDGQVLEAMSKTGLEALACGCKVIRFDEKIIRYLPRWHYPLFSTTLLYCLYLRLQK